MVGEISPAESNEIGLKKATPKTPSVARRMAPREGCMQVKLPRWLDRPYLKRYAAEHGCSIGEAARRVQQEEGGA